MSPPVIVGGGLTGLVAAERLVALPAPPEVLGALPVLCGAFVGLTLGLSRWPGLAEAALAADARFALQERLSSALAAGKGPMAELVRQDATRHAASLDLRATLPLRMPRSWPALAAGALTLVVAALLPPMDLLGWRAQRQAAEREHRLVRNATTAARARLSQLQAVAGGQEITRAVDRQLAELLARRPGLKDTVERGARLQQQTERALAEAERQIARTTDPTRRSELEGERAAAAAASRILAEWLENLGAVHQPERSGDGSSAEAFVRLQEAPAAPERVKQVGETLAQGSAAARAALRRDEIPWRYRRVVQRYFALEDESPASRRWRPPCRWCRPSGRPSGPAWRRRRPRCTSPRRRW